MKAICLLLGLAVVHEISGNIFHHRLENVRIRDLNKLRNHLQEQRYRHRQDSQQEEETQKIQDNRQEYDSRVEYEPLREYDSRQEYQTQEVRDNQQEQMVMPRREQQLPEHTVTPQSAPGLAHFQRQQQLSSEERNRLVELIRFADPNSEELKQMEYKESRSMEHPVEVKFNVPSGEYYAAPVFADKSTDIPTMIMRSAQRGDEKLFGDVVEWRGLRIAADSKQSIRKRDIEMIYRDAQKAQEHLTQEEKEQFHKAVNDASEADKEEARLNATQLLKKYQYPVEEHVVKTDDGYYLQLFRVPSTKQVREVRPRPVVFLMHGLLGSADDYLLMGPKKSLAYLLSDEGYDVWLGNARSSKYAWHASKHRARPDYWQFSNDEIALFDLPAMIDYVLEASNQKKMFYVGHSLGATAFFALMATYPEYNEKIDKMFALAPMVYMTHVRSPMLRSIAPTSRMYQRLDKNIGKGEFKPSKELVHTMGGAMCMNEIGCEHVCSNTYIVMAGLNPKNLNISKIPSMLAHIPAGASVKQMEHYAQGYVSQDFRMYNFGDEINVKVYGENKPPMYDMKKVSAPVSLYYSQHDFLAHPKDVRRLKTELPNVADEYEVPEAYFYQMDFQFSKKAPELVYKRLLESLAKSDSY